MSIDPTKNVTRAAPDPTKLPLIGVDEEDLEKKAKDYVLTKEEMQTMMGTIYVCTKCKQESLGSQCRFRVLGARPGEPVEFKFRGEKITMAYERTVNLPGEKVDKVQIESKWELRCKACGSEMIPTQKKTKVQRFIPGLKSLR